ncbi:MAG: FAD-binding oxidoreductase [Bryobacteraceae bacterium]|jgi:FAD/FMN-containing dehydrogenase
MDTLSEHRRRCERLVAAFDAARAAGKSVALAKATSNLFRRRDQRDTTRIDVRGFHHVLRVDPESMTADVEGMTTYEAFVDATLRHGLLPTVAPQLKTITVGGAVSGVGIESSSFRYGLVHETVEEMEILTGDGRIVVCSQHQNPDLFYGFPNSYGTLGYALRLTIGLIPARRYVHLTHEAHTQPRAYFARIAELTHRASVDYLDGTIFGRDRMYVTTGQFADEAPRVSDYTYMGIYYRSIREKQEDWLTARDYIWRWDTDWFWCSKNLGAQNRVVRLLATPWALNSRTYQRIVRLAGRVLPDSRRTESVIQDVDIPLEHAPEFFDFLMREIGITPVWVCPFRALDPSVTYPLYALNPDTLYINFGFWDMIPTTHEDGFFNRKVEERTLALGGRKGLYSTAWYDEETFWKLHDRKRYAELKARYDPGGVFRDLYAKCVGRK